LRWVSKGWRVLWCTVTAEKRWSSFWQMLLPRKSSLTPTSCEQNAHMKFIAEEFIVYRLRLTRVVCFL